MKYQIETISASKLGTYNGAFGCPKKFWFRYVLGLQSKWKGTSLAIGIGVGRALQVSGVGSAGASLAKWFGTWESYCHEVWQDIHPDDKLGREKMVDKGKDMLRAFYTSGIRSIGGIPECEVRRVFRCPDTGEELAEYVGFLDWYDPVLHRITELKTVAAHKSHDTWLLQLSLYQWATEEEDRESAKISLVQINRAKTPRVKSEEVHLSDNQNLWIKRCVSKTIASIRDQHFYERPSFACKSCDFREACIDGNYSNLIERS